MLNMFQLKPQCQENQCIQSDATADNSSNNLARQDVSKPTIQSWTFPVPRRQCSMNNHYNNHVTILFTLECTNLTRCSQFAKFSQPNTAENKQCMFSKIPKLQLPDFILHDRQSFKSELRLRLYIGAQRFFSDDSSALLAYRPLVCKVVTQSFIEIGNWATTSKSIFNSYKMKDS